MHFLTRLSWLSVAVLMASTTVGLARDATRRTDVGFGNRPNPAVERTKSCSEQGPGFKAVPGTSSCLKVFGRVQADVSSSRPRR